MPEKEDGNKEVIGKQRCHINKELSNKVEDLKQAIEALEADWERREREVRNQNRRDSGAINFIVGIVLMFIGWLFNKWP